MKAGIYFVHSITSHIPIMKQLRIMALARLMVTVIHLLEFYVSNTSTTLSHSQTIGNEKPKASSPSVHF